MLKAEEKSEALPANVDWPMRLHLPVSSCLSAFSTHKR
jgi:hypothetical protein